MQSNSYTVYTLHIGQDFDDEDDDDCGEDDIPDALKIMVVNQF